MQFQDTASASDGQPGWFCSCGYRKLVRPAKLTFSERSRALMQRSVNARRDSMRVTARADRLLKESKRLRAARSRKKT